MEEVAVQRLAAAGALAQAVEAGEPTEADLIAGNRALAALPPETWSDAVRVLGVLGAATELALNWFGHRGLLDDDEGRELADAVADLLRELAARAAGHAA